MHKHILLLDDSFCLLCRSATSFQQVVSIIKNNYLEYSLYRFSYNLVNTLDRVSRSVAMGDRTSYQSLIVITNSELRPILLSHSAVRDRFRPC